MVTISSVKVRKATGNRERLGGRKPVTRGTLVFLYPVIPESDLEHMRHVTKQTVPYAGEKRKSHTLMVTELVRRSRLLEQIQKSIPDSGDAKSLEYFGQGVVQLLRDNRPVSN